MLEKKLYGHAMVCFEKSGDVEYKIKSEACLLAKEASLTTGKARTEKFILAAEKFKSTGELKQSAQCYFSAKEYAKAAILFSECGMNEESVKCNRMILNWIEMAENHISMKQWKQALDCFVKGNAYEEGLKFIVEHKEEAMSLDWKKFISKYCDYFRRQNNREKLQEGMFQYLKMVKIEEIDALLPHFK
jgi:hypothetical protein